MAGTTTAYTFAGPLGVGPFGSRSWRVHNGIALIEKHRPVWMPASIVHGASNDWPIESIIIPGSCHAAEQLVFMVAATSLRDPGFMEALSGHGLTRRIEGPYEKFDWPHFDETLFDSDWEMPDALLDAAIDSVRDGARLGIVRLEPDSWLDMNAAAWLRDRGLDVDEYDLTVAGGEGRPPNFP